MHVQALYATKVRKGSVCDLGLVAVPHSQLAQTPKMHKGSVSKLIWGVNCGNVQLQQAARQRLKGIVSDIDWESTDSFQAP